MSSAAELGQTVLTPVTTSAIVGVNAVFPNVGVQETRIRRTPAADTEIVIFIGDIQITCVSATYSQGAPAVNPVQNVTPGPGLIEKFSAWLTEAREEAEQEAEVVPLTQEAENACMQFARWFVGSHRIDQDLKLVVTARLNGGATFIAVSKRTQRRFDIEFEPNGQSASIFSIDKNHKTTSEPFDLTDKNWHRYVKWFFQE